MSKETEKKIADLEEKLKRISSTGGVTLTMYQSARNPQSRLPAVIRFGRK